jgi:hypothetical protein
MQLTSLQYVPHVDLFLQALRINRERLNSKSKVAIDAKLLKALLKTIVQCAPFSEEFYLEAYADIAEAYAAGQIPDLHRHYIEFGFFEGRVGAPAPVDEAYYTNLYKDVGQAMLSGEVKSGAEHYIEQGSAEGRIPNLQLKPVVESWMDVLGGDAGRG